MSIEVTQYKPSKNCNNVEINNFVFEIERKLTTACRSNFKFLLRVLNVMKDLFLNI